MVSVDTFSSRIHDAMKTRGIGNIEELAAKLSKRLGRTIRPKTLIDGFKKPGGEMRTDLVHALADELLFSTSWLALGFGMPQRWVALDSGTKEIAEIFSGLSIAAQSELTSYAYRLLRVSGGHKRTLTTHFQATPQPKDFP